MQLSKDDLLKAYRMMKKDVDIDQFVSIFESLSSAARGTS